MNKVKTEVRESKGIPRILIYAAFWVFPSRVKAKLLRNWRLGGGCVCWYFFVTQCLWNCEYKDYKFLVYALNRTCVLFLTSVFDGITRSCQCPKLMCRTREDGGRGKMGKGGWWKNKRRRRLWHVALIGGRNWQMTWWVRNRELLSSVWTCAKGTFERFTINDVAYTKRQRPPMPTSAFSLFLSLHYHFRLLLSMLLSLYTHVCPLIAFFLLFLFLS